MLHTSLLPLLLFVPAGEVGPVDAATLSARIDTHVAAGWKKENVQPAPLAADAEFFRRLSLDLNGRIPSVAQLKDFLDDKRPGKRRWWIDELLDGPDNAGLYVTHFAQHWRHRLLAQVNSQQATLLAPRLEDWARQQIKANVPHDRFVRDLLTDPAAASFYLAHDGKPEAVAGSTARLFLGIKLECAQCHDDRSGGSWTQAQFWEFAAFFAALPRTQPAGDAVFVPSGRDLEDRGPARLQIQDTGKWADARFLKGVKLKGDEASRPRRALAAWLTALDNPWFARNAVNRSWHYFLGTGLIDPIDGLGRDDNPASHPELLDELTRQFIAHGHDMKYLIRAITGSQTYQRTSRQTHASQKGPRLFARARVRGLSAEQLYHSTLAALGHEGSLSTSKGQARGPLFSADSPQAKFFAQFHDPHAEPAEAHLSIQQALFLMNSAFTDEVTHPKKSRVLAVVAGNKARSTAQCIEDLFLATLSRLPRPEETKRLVSFVEKGPRGDRTGALRDVLWALLNSTEFVLNH
jgi:hypothetical protein